VPKLWTETISEHRRAVHDATLDTTAALVREHGLASVTMSQIAAAAGIGRATLYKYFPDVEAILVAWHDRHIARHLRQLAEARDAAATPADRVEAVLEAFALIQHQHYDTELPVALLHRGEHVARARRQLQTWSPACSRQPPRLVPSGPTSRPASSPVTACTPWPPPEACPPRRPCGGFLP
jgi:AcrR family transcriptional regulator